LNSAGKQFNDRLTVDLIALVILVAVVYGRSLGHDFLRNFDDNWYVLYNDAVRGFSWNNLQKAFSNFYVSHYLPLQIVSYMLDYTLWGLEPAGFHLTNMVIHTVNGLLIYRLFRHWYGERLFALVGAVVFLVHPVQVETVAWISQRKSLLSMLFLLLAWEGYRHYREAEPGRKGLAYAASVTAFALSLLSKVMSIVFPLILVAYDRCFYPHKSRLWRKDTIPFFLLAGVFACINIYSQNSEKGIGAGPSAVYPGGSPWATFLTMLPVFCRYLGMLVWPTGLSPAYAPAIHRTVDAGVLAAALVLFVLAALPVLLYRRSPRLGFWVFFFWISLLPVANIIPMTFLMQDHFLYLPMMGVAALTGGTAVWLRDRLGTDRRKLLYLLLCIPLLVLAVSSMQRLNVWRNDLTLWSDAVVKEPSSYKAWECYGDILRFSGKSEESRRAYERSLELGPDRADAMASLGDLYTETGELGKGRALLQKLLKIRPAYVTGWVSLGNNYLKHGDFVEAEKAYRHAQSLQPEAWQVLPLLGNLARIQGRLDQARAFYEQVESRVENDAENSYNLACVESLAGNLDNALAWLEKALQRGYGDVDKMLSDKQLSSLRNEPAFIDLLQRYGFAR
jgi:Flp pilus assembly protein TadD